MPPDLGKPYSSEAERAFDREALIVYWLAIETLTNLAEQPPSSWTPKQVSQFPRSVPGGPQEHPEQRLKRWLLLFGDEISAIQGVRSRLVHTGAVSDPELRGAAWLARQVLSTAMGGQPSMVTPMWARTLIANAAA
jgi:hypothetical protein